jgi:rhodanese-related sulfurtransferase
MQALNVSEFHALLQGPQAAHLCLLDVREAWEVALARIEHPGLRQVHIPMGQLPQRLAELSGQGPLVCLCHHGVRSAQVAAFLEGEGLMQVFNLSGGIHAWSSAIDPSVPVY